MTPLSFLVGKQLFEARDYAAKCGWNFREDYLPPKSGEYDNRLIISAKEENNTLIAVTSDFKLQVE